MPAVAAVVGFLGTAGGAVVAAGVIGAVQSFSQAAQIKRTEKKQEKFLARERALVGEPEDFEPGIRESFLERETPRLQADLAARGLTRSSDFERSNIRLGVEADRLSRDAALRRWQAQASVAQRQVEVAFSGGAQVAGPGPIEAFIGGAIGQAGKESQTGGLGGVIAPIFSGPTPGVTGRRAPDEDLFSSFA